ncbi:hypothetical protein SISNIDRAFT_423337 [Sistotremastrum niveocremeum HHB9708]|nr:hypothetical protein SISNIDRAFT_423337 [Sistotremastrum niveocremeum HHB9708]
MLTIEFYKSPGGKDVIPTVDITEASETIDSLLRFIYPIRRPVIFAPDIPLDESLTGLVVLLKTADKYQMDGVLFELRTLLMSPPLLKEHPVRVYAIACMYGFDPEAKIASRHTLNVDILRTPLFPELSQITARNYIRLIQLHQARATSALSVLYSMSPSCTGCSKERDGPLWWIEFKERARDELRQRPTSDAIFNASFLARCVVDSKSICPHCPLSYLNAATQARLDHLKERIDQLPDTID